MEWHPPELRELRKAPFKRKLTHLLLKILETEEMNVDMRYIDLSSFCSDQLPFRPVKSLFPYFPLRLTQFIYIRISYNNYFYYLHFFLFCFLFLFIYLFIYFYIYLFIYLFNVCVCACVCESLLIIQCQF